jgi:hypothetical protein
MGRREREDRISAAVRAFAIECGNKRAIAPTLHLGSPTGEFFSIREEQWYDDALRADLAERALSCLDGSESLAWLTRPGELAPQDLDHAWSAATTAAALRIPCRTTFYVVTRRGWLELRTGRSREWSRVRQRPSRR